MIIHQKTYLKVVKEGSAIPWPVNTKIKIKTQQQQKKQKKLNTWDFMQNNIPLILVHQNPT